MKTLIAISSCERDAQRDYELAIRQTWAKDLPGGDVEYRFFRGRDSKAIALSDTEILDCGDDYLDLPSKTRESLRWAVARGFDFVFRAFTDTCIHPQRLLSSGFESHDYSGHFPGGYANEPDRKGNYAYASGGPGYWLSRRACEAVVNSEPDHWAEDLWVGNVMGRNGILGEHEPRFFFKWSRPKSDTISVHLSRGTGNYEAEWMRHCYRELLES